MTEHAQAETQSDGDHAGMPALDKSAETVSWFEFAPMWAFYLPVYLYAGLLALRYGGLRSALTSNPDIPMSGLVGESKSTVLDTVKGDSQSLVARYGIVTRSAGDTDGCETADAAEGMLQDLGLTYPIVVKPDLGMRGAGVQVARSKNDLKRYGAAFPSGADFLVQELIDYEGEAGIFYVRHPGWEKGQIISVTLKYFPRVIGDGQSTLEDLILKDPRAQKVPHLYMGRMQDRLKTVPPEGEPIRLAFAGNHSKGTIFRDGTDHVTPAMEAAFDQIAEDMGRFYVGRFDVRFDRFDALKAGTGFRIIEVNGAGGEATHIWDSRMTLRKAYGSLFNQFGHIFRIGHENRKTGVRPPSYSAFRAAMAHEKALTEHYPETH